MNLPEVEKRLTDKRDLMSTETRQLAQKIISNLRRSKEDVSITTTKLAFGELCRALEIEGNKTKDVLEWYYTFWESEAMIISVMVSTEVSLFETMGEAFKPAFNNQKQKR